MLAHLVHRDDPRVPQLGDAAGLAEEAASVLLRSQVAGAGTLIATTRSSCGSRALYTVPKAPTPTVSISSNRPTRRWPPRGLQEAVDSRSRRKVEPQAGQTTSPAGRPTSSMGLRQWGQRMRTSRPARPKAAVRSPSSPRAAGAGGVRKRSRPARSSSARSCSTSARNSASPPHSPSSKAGRPAGSQPRAASKTS